MGLKFSLSAAMLIVLCGVGAYGYAMTSLDIEELILCSTDEGGFSIPAPICKTYMLHLRGTEEDIAQLEAGAGLAYALGSPGSADRFVISRFLLEQGLDINSPNKYTSLKLTPLHSAVLDNDPEAVSFLIDSGADKAAKTAKDDMTPLDLAKSLQASDPATDRSAVIAALES